jgi:hypothetical protein
MYHLFQFCGFHKFLVVDTNIPLNRINRMVGVGFKVFTAVTMRNAMFWDIETPFIPHRNHIVSATETSWLTLCKI